MKPINVLSLFNGMSTGHTALDNLGIRIDKYYSSELKPHAIELTQYHYPETIQLGDVNNWREWDIDWKSIDLLLSGSPCKDLSIAGKRKGINGSNSGLFWKFIEILEHIKKVNSNVIFFQENVGSAAKEDVGIMSRAMGVYPVRFNSSLVTAQLRDRYYWTNAKTKPFGMFGDLITDIPPPKDKGIMFKDVLENGYTNNNKSQALLESEAKTFGYKNMEKFTNLMKRRTEKGKQLPNMVFVDKDKANCILESESRPHKNQDSLLKRSGKGFTNVVYSLENYTVRILSKVELCRLQGFPDNHCDILTRNKAASLLGDGWTLPIIEHIFSFFPFKKEN